MHKTLPLQLSLDSKSKQPIWAISGAATEETAMVTSASDLFIHVVDVLGPG